jgi:predicted ATPase/class 3 adenylate cyclase
VGQLPTGTVAFVFTDIEGSTRLARSLPDAFPGLLDRHREILRGAFAGGIEVDSAGDAFFVAFAEVAYAALAAAEVQRRLAVEPWPEGGQVRVRIGLHAGIANVVGTSYVGAEVHRAARVCSAAHGGQVLVSGAAARLAQNTAGVSLRPLGEYWLKDFDAAPEALHQLVADGLGEFFPPPRTAEAGVVSLPREQTSFIGRDRELAELLELVLAGRLVTLTGEGGSGKSRLAVRAARNLAPRFRGPVVFVALARLRDADEAVRALASALQLDGMLASWDEAAEVLEAQNALIVWDNAEHLPGLADRLATLRDRCGRLHALVTSRRPLAIEGEQLYPVEPLDQAAAVDLLIERTRMRQPRFDAAAAEPELEQVARRLDGLPLALELAAARLRSLPVDALVERLDRQLEVLADAGGGRVDRHQTMRSALQWSYDLVDPADRGLFVALSVFAGPARLDAVADVAGMDEPAALDGLSRLIDASLIRLQDSDEARYWMLEPVRQFAADALGESGRAPDLHRRMLGWYTTAAAAMADTHEKMARAFRRERENLLRALAYAAELDEWETGIELAFDSVGVVFGVGGTSEAVLDWVRMAESVQKRLSLRAQAKLALLDVPREESPIDRARRGVALARQAGDRRLLSHGLIDVAFDAVDDGELETAEAALDEAAALDVDDVQDMVNIRLERARIAELRHETAAGRWWEEARTIALAKGDGTDRVRSGWNLARAKIAHGDVSEARVLLEEALAEDQTWEAWLGTELALRAVAGVASALDGETRRAAVHLHRALVIFDRVGAFDRLVELPNVLLTVAVVLAQAGLGQSSASLFAWVGPQLADPGGYDPHATRRQRQLVDCAPVDPPVDRDQAMRLALDGMAMVMAGQTAA